MSTLKVQQILVIIFVISLQITNSQSPKPDLNVDMAIADQFFNILQFNISMGCLTDLYTISTSLKHYWVLKLIDSSAKSIPAGLLEGNGLELGDYDECLSIQHKNIKGKYCLYKITIKPMNLSFAKGICIPHKCSTEDLITILDNLFIMVNISNLWTIEMSHDTCSTADTFNFSEIDHLTM
ncbi:uncharacterized protein LOC123292540 [Chrysoperla carnea]|uniref:uncharacterized protein LOC123292540 n=1 Tax=Chrysoperla carnea TaxID=189513 RepID=UPI001D08E582|nr:uncharacterized protein LOC123292540 [Chrysoperla carnea]